MWLLLFSLKIFLTVAFPEELTGDQQIVHAREMDPGPTLSPLSHYTGVNSKTKTGALPETLITCELLGIKNSSGRQILKSSTEFSAGLRLIHTPWLLFSSAFCQQRSVSLPSFFWWKIMRHREIDLTCLKHPAGAGGFGASVQKVQH